MRRENNLIKGTKVKVKNITTVKQGKELNAACFNSSMIYWRNKTLTIEERVQVFESNYIYKVKENYWNWDINCFNLTKLLEIG